MISLTPIVLFGDIHEVARQIESLVDTAKQLMQEIAIIDYSKAA